MEEGIDIYRKDYDENFLIQYLLRKNYVNTDEYVGILGYQKFTEKTISRFKKENFEDDIPMQRMIDSCLSGNFRYPPSRNGIMRVLYTNGIYFDSEYMLGFVLEDELDCLKSWEKDNQVLYYFCDTISGMVSARRRCFHGFPTLKYRPIRIPIEDILNYSSEVDKLTIRIRTGFEYGDSSRGLWREK